MNIKNLIRYHGLKLFKANIIMTQKISLVDANGKILKSNEKVSDSLTGNFLQLLYAMFSAGNILTWQVTPVPLSDGTANNKVHTTANSYIAIAPNNINTDSGAANTNFGIQFGSGAVAVTPSDYKINTLIPHGAGGGQLNYLGMTAPNAPLIVGINTTFKLLRMANNASGADITVNEVALVAQTSAANYTCIYRDLVSPALVIPNGLNAICELTWQITT